MKYISLNWTLALKFSIGKKKRMCDCRILMAHDCAITRKLTCDTEMFDISISNNNINFYNAYISYHFIK